MSRKLLNKDMIGTFCWCKISLNDSVFTNKPNLWSQFEACVQYPLYNLPLFWVVFVCFNLIHVIRILCPCVCTNYQCSQQNKHCWIECVSYRALMGTYFSTYLVKIVAKNTITITFNTKTAPTHLVFLKTSL